MKHSYAALSAVMCVVLVGLGGVVCAQENSAQGTRFDAVLASLNYVGATVRVVYVGPQDHPIPGILFRSANVTTDSGGLQVETLPSGTLNGLAANRRVVVAQNLLRDLLVGIKPALGASAATSVEQARVVLTIEPGAGQRSESFYFDRLSTRQLASAMLAQAATDPTASTSIRKFGRSIGAIR